MAETLSKSKGPVSPKATESDQNILLAAKGGGIAFVGNFFVYVFRFVFGIVLARLLGAELLGHYTLGLTIVDILTVLSLLGFGAGIVRFIPIAISKKDDLRLWGVIQIVLGLPVVLSTILAAGVFLLAEPIALTFFDLPELVPVLRVASLGIPLYALMSELSSITQGFKRMEYQVYAEDITLNLLKLVLTVIFLLLGLGVVGAVLAHNISVAVAMGMLLLFVHRLFPLNRPLNPAKRDVREMLGFTLPVYLTRVLSRFSGHIESLILGSLGLVSGVGVYTTALRLSGVGMLFHQSLQRIAMPMISDLYSRGERKQLNRMYRTLTKWGLTFNLPIFLTIALFAEPLLSIFGSDFVAGASGLVILAFANLFNASTGVCGSMITMSGHSKLTFINSIEYLVINVALDIVLIPRWGVVGAALAVTLTEVTINILRTIQVLVLLGSWPYDWSYLKPLAASLLAGGAAYLVRQWMGFAPGLLQLLVGGVVLWVIYACVIIVLRLSEEDRLVLNRLWARYRPGRS